ncbi:MAG: protein kinase domain-containing protein [Leptolyngbyaceae cyanobacterium]
MPHHSAPALSPFRSSAINETLLGQLCGTSRVFRDRYTILKIIGRGGFGITALAKDISLPGRPLCVIKQLCPRVSDTAILSRARQRFEQEAKSLSLLGSHTQIPQLLDYFETQGDFFLVQEYIQGITLAKMIRRSGCLDEAAVKHFLRDLLLLLQYVHNNRVIHRDIKPHNLIYASNDHRLVLIDFGAVKEWMIQSDRRSNPPPSTQFVGTVGFAPPEQLAGRPVYASDLYAAGITCLYLLSGRSVLEFDYSPDSRETYWQSHVTVSPYFGAILSRLLKFSLKDRYQSAAEVLRALDLEPFVDNLKYCMNVNPVPFAPKDEAQGSSAISPILRDASVIREWQVRARLRWRRCAI